MTAIRCPKKGCEFRIQEIDAPALADKQKPNRLGLLTLANGGEISSEMYQDLSVTSPHDNAERMWKHVRTEHPLYLPKEVREAAYDQGLMRMLQRLLDGRPIDIPRAQVGRFTP